MNIGNLLFSPTGRISRKPFWIGFVIIVVVYFALSLLSLVAGPLASLIALITIILVVYMACCVHSKRLHDFGKTGWLFGLALIATFILFIIGLWPAVSVAMEAIGENPEIENWLPVMVTLDPATAALVPTS
jgi:uncharacterized membrane protein YhaH (DUF805 family)